MLPQETHCIRIVQVVVFDKRNGGDGTLHGFILVHDHALHTHLLGGDVLTDDCIGACPERQSYSQTQEGLSHQLIDRSQSVLCHLHLDIVVDETYQAKPQRGTHYQQQVDIAQSAEQQTGHQCGHYYDDASHGGHTFLLHAVRIYLGVSLGLVATVVVHPTYEVLAKPHGYEQTQNQCKE